jgi:hypothetical protein
MTPSWLTSAPAHSLPRNITASSAGRSSASTTPSQLASPGANPSS